MRNQHALYLVELSSPQEESLSIDFVFFFFFFFFFFPGQSVCTGAAIRPHQSHMHMATGWEPCSSSSPRRSTAHPGCWHCRYQSCQGGSAGNYKLWRSKPPLFSPALSSERRKQEMCLLLEKANVRLCDNGGGEKRGVACIFAQVAQYFGCDASLVIDVGVAGLHRVLSRVKLLGSCVPTHARARVLSPPPPFVLSFPMGIYSCSCLCSSRTSKPPA